MPKLDRRAAGFTLSELLIVISLVILLSILFFLTSWKTQVTRANDAKRKDDLEHIRVAMEDYYNDHSCYPALDVLATCGGAQFSPYIAKVPCDPVTKLPYKYVPIDVSDICKGYRVLTTLGDTADPAIIEAGCTVADGCGYGVAYNWGVSSGSVSTGISPTPGVTPTYAPGNWACAPGGVCNNYADPSANGCPVTYSNPQCDNQCVNPANWCLQ